MEPLLAGAFANASSLHGMGVDAGRAVQEARVAIAEVLDVRAEELVFTSGGTEADNLAVLGVARHARRPANVVCSAIEHAAVWETCQGLSEEGVELRVLPVDRNGVVSVQDLSRLVDSETVLVSVMQANNELGTLQPVAALGSWLRANAPRARFHVDAVQGILRAPLDIHDAGIDLLSVSAHKLYGPKGVGLLWVRSGVHVRPLLYGGDQQRGLRPGTENVPGIVGLATALRRGAALRGEVNARVERLRDAFETEVLRRLPDTVVNGRAAVRVPGISSLSFPGCTAEVLLHHIGAEGVAAASGSACHARRKEQSHVLQAIGVPSDHGTLRFSLGRSTTEEDIFAAVAALEKAVPAVRRLGRGQP